MPKISGGGAPADIAYLLAAAAADARLPSSVAGGTAPLGELGNTWGAPNVDATHSGSAHHNALTIGADGEHSLATQVLSGVDAAAAQKGHIQLAGELGGTAAAPTITATHSGSAHHAAAHDHSGNSLGPLVLADFTTALAPAAPGAGVGRFYVVTGDRPGFRAGAVGAAEVLATLAAAQTWTALQSFGANLGGTLQTAAQPNVTSLGVLTGLTMGGALAMNNNSITGLTSITVQGDTNGFFTTASTNYSMYYVSSAWGTTSGFIAYGYTHATRPGAVDIITWDGGGGNLARLAMSSGGISVATWAAVYHVGLKYGLAGVATGAFTMDGATSGVLTVTVPAIITPWTLTLPATAGSVGQVMQSDGAGVLSWINQGWRRVGGNQTLQTTAGTTYVDLITISGLTIAVGTPVKIVFNIAHEIGAAVGIGVGLKLNTTVAFQTIIGSATDEGAWGYVEIELIWGRDTFIRALLGRAVMSGTVSGLTFTNLGATANLPTVTLTDVIIQVNNGNAGQSTRVQDVQVYVGAVA